MKRTRYRKSFGVDWLFGLIAVSVFMDHFVDQLGADEQPTKSASSALINAQHDKSDRESAKVKQPAMTTRQLLDTLKEQNAGQARFTDAWCRTLKEIVDLGSDAVPELIEELDATQDDMMLRSLGFILRAIGDKRAVPSLIRAIQKTLIPVGSDMGLSTDDPELLKFAQANDLDPRDRENMYGFSRPVREVGGALQKLTGTKLGEQELFMVHFEGSESQRERKREFFYRKARAWAEWWEQNWETFVQDEKYSKVGLPVRVQEDVVLPPSKNGRFKTGSGHLNWILESVRNPKAKRVFYDLDVGRVAALPEKWRDAQNIDAHIDEILLWAAREGFDLMGTEYETADGHRIFALHSIGMQVWELSSERWKMHAADIKLETLQAEGKDAGKLLLHFDRSTEALDPLATAPFLFITRHGTPGLLFVGVEVQDDSQKPGGRQQGDDELKPISFTKGRRFAFSFLEEIHP